MKNKELVDELKMAGARKEEIGSLQFIMEKLSPASEIERSFKHKRNFLERGTFSPKRKFVLPRWFFAPTIAFILLLLIGATVAKAQGSIPGDPLYPVKRLSENLYSAVNPNFKNQEIIRRSEEVKKLTEENNNAAKVEKAVNDYQKVISNSGKNNQKIIEQSQENLEAAREKAYGESKRLIEKVLTPEPQKTENKDVKGEDEHQLNKPNKNDQAPKD